MTIANDMFFKFLSNFFAVETSVLLTVTSAAMLIEIATIDNITTDTWITSLNDCIYILEIKNSYLRSIHLSWSISENIES